jgi:hypothetical protein
VRPAVQGAVRDWKFKVSEEEAYCAICGEDSAPPAFNTEEQQESIRAQAIGHVSDQLDEVFRSSTPRRQDMGLISMSLTTGRAPRVL